MASTQLFPPTLERFEVNGVLCSKLVFEILALTDATSPVAAEAITEAYTEFTKAYGGSFRYFQLNDSKRNKKFNAKAEGLVPSWMSDAKKLSQPLLGIQINSGPSAEELQAPDFAFFQDQSARDQCGYLRLCVPAQNIQSFSDAQPLLEMLRKYPLGWGFAGYAPLWNPGGSESRSTARWLTAHLKQYPGLGSGQPLAYMVRQHLGLLNMGWLTLIGQEMREHLGGHLSLAREAKLNERVTTHDFGAWSALVAGDGPKLGDLEQHDTLPSHRAVGKIIETVRAPRTMMEQVFLKPLRLETADYLERFFVDSPSS